MNITDHMSFKYCCALVAKDETAPVATFDSDVTVTWPVAVWRRWRAETNCSSEPNIFNPHSSFVNSLLSFLSAFWRRVIQASCLSKPNEFGGVVAFAMEEELQSNGKREVGFVYIKTSEMCCRIQRNLVIRGSLKSS